MHEYEQIQKFGAGGDTVINPIASVLILLTVILILILPRHKIIAPLLVASLFIPLGQVIMIGGLHFYVMRLLIIFGWVRVVASGWLSDYRSCRIDRAIILWGCVDTIAFVLLWQQSDALINRLGFLYNLLGFYLLFRILYRSPEDVDRTIKVFAFICFALGLCMINEKITGRNLFWIFGGVPQFTDIREGSLRAQGPFAHPILAGTFGAILLPLFIGLWWRQRKSRWLPSVGIASALAMIIASASSTPILAAVGGLLGLCFWPLRNYTRIFRWGLALALVSLHLVMKAPVWALIGRINVIGGSSGDHRYELVNRFILHFSDWWLLGTKYTGDWGYLMHDVSNQFVGAGTEGGLAGFALFIWIIVCCFHALGIARKRPSATLFDQKLLWSLGATLLACIFAFFGTAFFDQTIVAWYALLAMIVVTTRLVLPVTELAARRQIPIAIAINAPETTTMEQLDPVKSL